jgi:hypothetical protein
VVRDSLPGLTRVGAFSFVIDGVGYVGGGATNGPAYLADYWSYDVLTRTWSQKASLPPGPRYGASAFAIGKKGYMGTGFDGNANNNDFW